MNKMIVYGLPKETLLKVKPIYDRLGPVQRERVNHVSFLDVAKSLGYNGPLITRSGRYIWKNSINMIMDLCWYNEEEAKLYIVTKFPYVYGKSAYGQVWF